MNAALQVLFNTKPLTEYFKQNLHLFELNIHNKMSTKGHLTMRYAELLKEILSAQTRSIAPIKFRFSVSKFAPQFTNGMQHDSQELLAWLLDTLHEDLNRVTEKPYIEIKDSNGRSDQLVAKEAYDAFLKRNNSVIVDLFYGQMKSKVACLTCNTESVRFEPFSLLSLPLPLENFVLCEVLLTKLNGEFPIKYAVKLNSDCKYWDLKNHLSELCNLDAASILICQVDSSQIKYIFTNDQKIVSSSALNLYAYELPKIQELEKTVVEKEVVGNNLKDIQRQKGMYTQN
jgi:ubiquitin carboxyl-terminal hydrolase 6/32